MQTTVTVRLDAEDSAEAIIAYVRRFNAACDWLSSVAFAEKLWHWLPLQRRAYMEIRERFGLHSQATLVVVRKVAYAYRNKCQRSRLAKFRPMGAMALRRHRFRRDGFVSFYGFCIPFKCAPDVVLSSKCEAKLIMRGKKLLLLQPIEADEPGVRPADEYLGVDLGVVNIATDSDGEDFAGAHLNGLRRRHNSLRARLQAKGTKSALRLLRHRSGREARFARCVNHRISKSLVVKAHGSGRGIALEDLKGIRSRIKARRSQRGALHSWAFSQLRGFIEYKARLSGVPVVTVNPRNTSRTCPECGHIDKRNRPRRDDFKCVSCGCAGHADAIAAENIRRAAGNRPYAVVS